MFKKTKIDNYTLEEFIGKGQFSEVFLASKEETSEKFAIKKYLREIVEKDKSILKDLKNEILVLKKLNHPNIIKLKECKKSKNALYMIYEYCNGEKLFKIIQDYIKMYNKQLSEEIVQNLMRQIIDTLEFIHSKGIYITELEDNGYLNNDSINLDNILINFDSQIDKEKINLMKANVKMINFKKAYNNYYYFGMKEQTYSRLNKNREKIIIFCLGKICYELLTGKTPFEEDNLDKLGDYFIPNYLSIEAIHFLNSTLQNSDKLRVSLNDIHKLDFLSKNINDFHFCDFSTMTNFDNLNLNIKGIIVNINNDKDKEDILTNIKKENKDKNENKDNNEISDKENPFYNLKESVEIDINKNNEVNDKTNNNNKANENNAKIDIKDSVALYKNKYLKKPK